MIFVTEASPSSIPDGYAFSLSSARFFSDAIFAQENRSFRNDTKRPILPGGAELLAQENRSFRNDTKRPILPSGAGLLAQENQSVCSNTNGLILPSGVG